MVDLRRLVSLEIADPLRDVGGGVRGGNQVGAGKLVALRDEQAGQAAHAAAADPDEMDLLRTAPEQLREALFYVRLHDASISSATRWAASSPASLPEASAMPRRSGTSFRIPDTVSKSASGVVLLSTRMRAAPARSKMRALNDW